jgi:hypothetical protein
LLPYLGVFAAWGASQLASRPGRARVAVSAAWIASLALPAAASTKLAWLRSRPDTFEQAASWIRDNVREPDAERIWVLPPVDAPLLRTRESLRHPTGRATFHSPWSKYQRGLEDGIAGVTPFRLYWLYPKDDFRPARLGTDEGMDEYLASFEPGLWLVERVDARRSFDRHHLVERLRARAPRLARFSPDGDPELTEHPLGCQDIEAPDWPHVFWRVLRARAVGSVVEIYRGG